MQHENGKDIAQADALSRLVEEITKERYENKDLVVVKELLVAETVKENETKEGESELLKTLKETGEMDSQYTQWINWFGKQGPATEEEKKEMRNFLMMEGRLHRVVGYKPLENPDTPLRLVIPEGMRTELVRHWHTSLYLGAHTGVQKLLKLIQARYWWPGLSRDVIAWVKDCRVCARHNIVSRGVKEARQRELPPRPFHTIGMDITGPLPTTARRRNKYILVIVDLLTHFVIAVPLTQASTEKVYNILQERVFPVFGIPEKILSDNGTCFVSGLA